MEMAPGPDGPNYASEDPRHDEPKIQTVSQKHWQKALFGDRA